MELNIKQEKTKEINSGSLSKVTSFSKGLFLFVCQLVYKCIVLRYTKLSKMDSSLKSCMASGTVSKLLLP